MAEELVMPRLSDTMERGTVARWLKQEGETVAAGEIVAEIETDKATMDYQSDVAGVLLKILVPDGASAELGAPIGYVGEHGEAVPGDDGAGDPGGSAAGSGADGGAPAAGARPEAGEGGASTETAGRHEPGMTAEQWPVARTQRGEKGQPGGSLASDGVMPGIWASGTPRLLRLGTEPMRPAV